MSNDYSKGVDGGQGKHRGPRFTWNTQFEATFFRSLCESVQLGLREGSTFKPDAWDRAIQALIEKHNAYANKGHLINKSDNARKKYRLWRGLREDPAFYYNPQARTVTGSEDAWARHLQKEPLARSLKGRPFDHEEYYEVLFPDVIGSGGAPKRMTKPRRKGPDIINGVEEHEGPGTSIMDMLSDSSYLNPVQTQHIPAPVQSTTIPPPMPAPLPPPPQQLSRPPPAPMAPPPPPRSSAIPTSSALTPPEENPTQARKRQHASDSNTIPSPSQSEKRRRTQPPNYIDLQQSNNNNTNSNNSNNNNLVNGHTVNGSSSANSGGGGSGSSNNTIAATTTAIVPSATPTITSSGTISDGITLIVEALRGAKARPSWQEQAMEILFRDFRDEDPDLQIKIAEKALTDENKAMFFCKMPETLRKHWVKRLREVHNNRAT